MEDPVFRNQFESHVERVSTSSLAACCHNGVVASTIFQSIRDAVLNRAAEIQSTTDHNLSNTDISGILGMVLMERLRNNAS
jgi:hypothetical protein